MQDRNHTIGMMNACIGLQKNTLKTFLKPEERNQITRMGSAYSSLRVTNISQLDISKASNSISDLILSIFTENLRFPVGGRGGVTWLEYLKAAKADVMKPEGPEGRSQ